MTLKKYRMENGMSRKQLGYKINRTEQQIQRYETVDKYGDKQYPPLNIFKQLCLSLQVSADEMLGLKWVVNDNRYDGYILKWKLDSDSLYWTCPKCNRKNITYGDFEKHKKLLLNWEFVCEYDDCNSVFYKLLEFEK